MMLRAALLITVAACGGMTESERFRYSLEHAPAMHHPASGKLDPIPSDSFMGSFRIESYTPARVCFLARVNVPPDVAKTVEFRLEGYRAPADYPTNAQLARTHDVTVLDVQELELRWKRIELAAIGGSHVYQMQRAETDRSMFNTGLDICFAQPHVPSADTRYLVIQTDPDDPAMQHHRVGAMWQLTP